MLQVRKDDLKLFALWTYGVQLWRCSAKSNKIQIFEKSQEVLWAHLNTTGLTTYIEAFRWPQSVKKSRELQGGMGKDSILMSILKYCNFRITPEEDTDSKESNHLILGSVV
ncbi:uncharacterized protein LOC143202863 [Rhynchophorus ferrugineus]|uniref:uncharacterized protein LOC143202863 n=1 Tax=Rhynchophorus ferrugineus TaxID=354439 RepID=UPI003FCCC6B2